MKWFANEKIKNREIRNLKLIKSIEAYRNELKQKQETSLNNSSLICLNSNRAIPELDKTQPNDFKDIFEHLTVNIEQYIEFVNTFQAKTEPIFNEIYKKLRSLILEFFTYNIEVL